MTDEEKDKEVTGRKVAVPWPGFPQPAGSPWACRFWGPCGPRVEHLTYLPRGLQVPAFPELSRDILQIPAEGFFFF